MLTLNQKSGKFWQK